MSSKRWFVVIAALFALAFGVSAFLYLRSRSADFDAHARAVEGLGRVRHLDRQLSEQVLAARFGLLNQYDPLTGSELELVAALAAVHERVGAVVGTTPELERALVELDKSVAERRSALEHFKAENSVLKNSLRYLPTAAEEVIAALGEKAGAARSHDINALVRAALVYDLIGDRGARDAHVAAIGRLAGERSDLEGEVATDFDLLLAHARVIADRHPSVDGWLRRASNDDVSERLRTVERVYQGLFGQAAATADQYRKILYAWSMILAVAVGLAGLQLRKVYAGLERRVAARTAELNRALDALWGEMKLARRIQEALVPSAPVLAGCDVAASMKPADQVGGDYYDVVHTKTHEWILIGDVSGHGVPAGLIMMMCQTAVRTTLEQDPEIMPDRLLVMVNSVLTQNIRQLGEDKYMTITALRRDAAGKIVFAGAHTDLFVYRADTDEIETLETAGIWLGLKPDADGAFTTQELTLRKRDLLILHTDGVTEATRDGHMFDTKGMRAALATAKGKSAQQVLDDLLKALEGFKLDDDATLLVIQELGGDPSDARQGLSPRSASTRPLAS
ncbi:MAG TPA: DAHL domain-containing protein [Polyangiaceae bacterium]|nr:DAHL domain-containing protein [Polyangiaceae bacterium]